METRSVSFGRLLAASLFMSVPTAAALIVLGAVSGVHMLMALIVYVAVLALQMRLIRPYLSDLWAVTVWTRALAAGHDERPPETQKVNAIAEIVGAVSQLRRVWQDRQRELETAVRWNATLLENLPDPLLLLDQDRRVVRVNRAAAQIFGRQAVGRDLAATLRDPNLLEATDLVLKDGQGQSLEFTVPLPVQQTFRARVEPLGSRAMDNMVALLALHDLTTIKKMEDMRADFIANASHELRTPLATLLGFIETIRGPARDDPEAQEKFLGIMYDQASRMTRLVNDLLSLSRIELNEHTAPSEPVPIVALVQKGMDALQPLAKAKSIRLILKAEDDVGLVRGQPDQLAQVIQNLIDNAVKYGREKTDIRVSVTRSEKPPACVRAECREMPHVVLSVQDQGDGIAKEHLPRLTERFYRVDTARSRTLGGTGLGLAIVKHIINRHRGALVIESTQGQGSCFTVYLPCAL